VSSKSVYSNDDVEEPLPRVHAPTDQMPKNQHRRHSGIAEKKKPSEFQNEAIMAMLTLMRKEQARARLLERRLYARELEHKAQRVSMSPDSDRDSIASQTRSQKNNKEMKEEHADGGNHSGEEDGVETMGQKFKAFLTARSDAQTESG